MSFDDLRTLVLSDSFSLNKDLVGGDAYQLGELHIAGPPCIDYSSMGRQRRENGPTAIVFLLWTRAVRDQHPLVVVFENVVRFPITMLQLLLGDLYHIDHVVLDAIMTGGPCRRRRLYCVLTLRGSVHLTRPLADLVKILDSCRGVALTGKDLAIQSQRGNQLSPSARRYLWDYKGLFPKGDFYDLAESPGKTSVDGTRGPPLHSHCEHIPCLER